MVVGTRSRHSGAVSGVAGGGRDPFPSLRDGLGCGRRWEGLVPVIAGRSGEWLTVVGTRSRHAELDGLGSGWRWWGHVPVM